MKKQNVSKLLSTLLIIAMVLGFVPVFSTPAMAVPADVTVSTEQELRDVLEKTSHVNIAIDDGGGEFILTAPIKINRPVALQGKNRKDGENAASRATCKAKEPHPCLPLSEDL